MSRLRCQLFSLFLTVSALRLCSGLEVTDELDTLLCPSVEVMRGKIIDVHRSLGLGAKLLDGSLATSLEQCQSQCCHRAGCDLALYKNEGVSTSGKNCYYIECVSRENCVMVEHSGFTSVVFTTETEDALGEYLYG